MRHVHARLHNPRSSLLFASLVLLWPFFNHASAAPSVVERRDNNPLGIDWGPAPPPEDGPPLSAGALRDPAYLPAQIGGIVGSYALSLVLVATVLLVLSKKRREALTAGDDEIDFVERKPQPRVSYIPVGSPRSIPRSPVRNFSYPSPDKAEFHPYVFPSPTSTTTAPGIDRSVDQRVVAADRDMAQQQLEDIYKHVMEQEEAKANGIKLEGTPAPTGSLRASTSDKSSTLSKKERNKPAELKLGDGSKSEKTQSRASSILSALRSPRKKGVKGISISSPIMTPMSGTFPRQESQEMNTIPPRHYTPAAPPPVPTNQVPFGTGRNPSGAPLTPELSPESTQSIDERIGSQLPQTRDGHSRKTSNAATVEEPSSATTNSSQAQLVGLPTSPKPGVTRFPSLPASPKPGATFQRADPPSAVRTGGTLPLRAYEPAMASPSATSQQTKQTVFERLGPLSPMSARTPYTGAAVPYSPYQPYTPCVPITPSLVTKADRKRMKKLEPKTPTMEMVKSSDDIW